MREYTITATITPNFIVTLNLEKYKRIC